MKPTIMNLKNGTKMGTIYKVRCAYCGTETDLPRRGGYGKFHTTSDWLHVETEIPIRCPGCMHRLNATPEEFRRQVEAIPARVW